jgi:S-adenosylhomocysteine hydrolase
MYSVTVNGKEPILNKDYFIQHNSVVFNEASISPNQEFCLRLYSIATPSDLGVVAMIKENNDGKIFENSVVIVIQHLLSDSVHLVNAFCDGGADKSAIFIVGIPYSTKHSTIKYLKNKGFNNIVSPDQYPFEKEVEEVMRKAIDFAEQNQKRIVVVEDGGYVVPLLHQKFLDKAHLFDGAVEQTANGIWRDKEIEGTYKIPFSIPIINVADSRIKDKLESPLIGRAVSKNIELIYNKTFRGLAGEKVGIIGFGRTGKKVAEDLKFHGSIVKVYDKDPINQSEAKGAGFELLGSISEVVKECKIIIESTGRTWEDDRASIERMNILLNFQHGSFFVSASSKRMGIDYVEFEKVIDKAKMLNIPGLGVRYKLRNNNEVTLVANGYPVNFFLGESVPDREIAFILALLYKSAELVVRNTGKLDKKIIELTGEKVHGFGDAEHKIADYHSRGLS